MILSKCLLPYLVHLTDNIDFTFTSSMFDRDIAYTYDYTQYVYYYGYDYYAAYYYDYDYYASTDPRVFYTQFDEYERTSNEFRIQSVTDSGYQWILEHFMKKMIMSIRLIMI